MNGILLLNKPTNMTSHDCVNQVRKLFHTKKVGHMGTLDPSVTGVLPLCINDATKIIQFIDHPTKEYIATILVGTSTTTEDHDGEVVEQDLSYKIIQKAQILSVLKTFLGEQEQIPPMISSIKINGKKLYEYARQNIEIERPSRKITIFDIELLSQEEEFIGEEVEFEIRVNCSKGTYIRTLAVDIGKKLGFPAHMKKLTRTKSGIFNLEQCVSFDDIKQGSFKLISLYESLSIYPMIEVDENVKQKIFNGQKLPNTVSFEFTYLVFCDIVKQVLAVYEKDPTNEEWIKPVRVFK